ncbi:50S ribosomal protein L9 [Engelhardtia mirabilis]|uniref:Large ribosomal subunit protein bL9 n=1 Tax=Engelhardtia mirabilis TaxID=2528011 RepID=A0A518BPJ0_9BACT|nr:50S ribosomal protein L9 [Planctomycetes bacterium Pla133]QDV03217.1 50S ribosomal protein L9 [Planctomycetes bacterium Pla86]
MKNVEILLRENVRNLGKVGDVVKVAPGYARNYLLPHGYAIQATPENVRALERRRQRLDAEEAQRAAKIEAVVNEMGGLRVETAQRADDTGTLYGSVSAALIADLLEASGHAIDERRIRLESPLKSVGEHIVEVHVHGDRTANVTVAITALGDA